MIWSRLAGKLRFGAPAQERTQREAPASPGSQRGEASRAVRSRAGALKREQRALNSEG